MGVEEDVDEGGGDGGQCFRVQREDTKAVLWTLDRMHRGVGPCWGNQEVESERRPVGWGAPWWLAREGPGLSVASCSTVTYQPRAPILQRVFPHTGNGPQWEEVPPTQVWVPEGALTMLSTGTAIAGIVPGNRHRLPAHLSVNVELLGQRVDHHGQVLLPHLGHRKMAYHAGPPAARPTLPDTGTRGKLTRMKSVW